MGLQYHIHPAIFADCVVFMGVYVYGMRYDGGCKDKKQWLDGEKG